MILSQNSKIWIGYQSKFSRYTITMVEHWQYFPYLLYTWYQSIQLHNRRSWVLYICLHLDTMQLLNTGLKHRYVKSKLNIVQLKIAIEHSYHDSLSPHILSSMYCMTADARQCMPAYGKWKTRFCQLFQVLDVVCRQVIFVTVTF